MANTLTGDFDVVAQFGVLTVDRLLAGMHQTGRFLHSISFRIDDNPRPGHVQVGPTIVGNVDAFGDAVANQKSVGRPGSAGSATATVAPHSNLPLPTTPDALNSDIAHIAP